jgi:DNA-binding response OmpR family regulator
MANILVADDDQQYAELLAKILEKQQHKVVVAYDGAEALKLFASQKFDLIITDILMPHVDGIELIMQLIEKDSVVPIIAMSGGHSSRHSSFNLQSANILGVQTILQKPFSIQQLLDAVNKLLVVN